MPPAAVVSPADLLRRAACRVGALATSLGVATSSETPLLAPLRPIGSGVVDPLGGSGGGSGRVLLGERRVTPVRNFVCHSGGHLVGKLVESPGEPEAVVGGEDLEAEIGRRHVAVRDRRQHDGDDRRREIRADRVERLEELLLRRIVRMVAEPVDAGGKTLLGDGRRDERECRPVLRAIQHRGGIAVTAQRVESVPHGHRRLGLRRRAGERTGQFRPVDSGQGGLQERRARGVVGGMGDAETSGSDRSRRGRSEGAHLRRAARPRRRGDRRSDLEGTDPAPPSGRCPNPLDRHTSRAPG